MLYELIILLAPWAGKMNQIPTERARWNYPASSGHPAVSWKKHFHENHIINLLFTKLVPSRWLDIHLILFCEYMDRKGVELGQIYPAILTSQLVNIPYIMIYHIYIMSFCFFRAHFITTQGTGAIRVNTTFLEGRLGLTHKRPSYPPTGTRLSPRSVFISY